MDCNHVKRIHTVDFGSAKTAKMLASSEIDLIRCTDCPRTLGVGQRIDLVPVHSVILRTGHDFD